MHSWTKQFLKKVDLISTSYWFIPSVCIFIAFILLGITQTLDQTGSLRHITIINALYDIDPSGARVLLTTVATAVITVTSIAFSMIIVSLTLASSQFGSRLLRNFIQDKKNQVAMGVFVATFVHCLALVRFISVDTDAPYVPGVGLSIALLLTLVSIFTLVYLIHHVALSIQADNVIERIWQSLQTDIERMCDETEQQRNSPAHVSISSDNCTMLTTRHDGYVQLIDTAGLTSVLYEHDKMLKLDIKPGDYLVQGQAIGLMSGEVQLTERRRTDFSIDSFIVIGSSRTPIQDLEFAINQLVEVALRALSPSINDPFTAITCIHRIGSGLALLATKKMPETTLTDSQGTPRLSRKTCDYSGVFRAACDQIRQQMFAHISVVMAFIEMLTIVRQRMSKPEHISAVKVQFAALVQSVEELKLFSEDKIQMEARLAALRKAL